MTYDVQVELRTAYIKLHFDYMRKLKALVYKTTNNARSDVLTGTPITSTRQEQLVYTKL